MIKGCCGKPKQEEYLRAKKRSIGICFTEGTCCSNKVLPEVTTTGNFPTILPPLVFILTVNAVKDWVEDYRRRKSDQLENERICLVSHNKRDGDVTDCRWYDIRVGDIAVIRQNEYVPADIVILASSHDSGHVFVETANLDGETNLKTKEPPEAPFKLIGGGGEDTWTGSVSRALKLEGRVDCEGPNEFLYSFAGSLHIGDSSKSLERVPLNEENILLRGCKVKNVTWALGLVVYTGPESKIQMNSKKVNQRKSSHLELAIGKFTMSIFLLQCLLCGIAAVCSAIFDTSEDNLKRTYLNLSTVNDPLTPRRHAVIIFVIRFFNFFILFSNFIPISLLVTLSMVKLFQVFFLYLDKTMIYNDISCMPRTSDLNEELGQVDYVFSDKTGTLTCNVMDFRKMCILGKVYGEGVTEIRRNVMLKLGMKVVEPMENVSQGPQTPHVNLVDHSLNELLQRRSGPQYEAIRLFLLHLAINHEVIPEHTSSGDLIYSANSPDEAALVYGARHFGFKFLSRDSKGILMQKNDGSQMRVRILVILKFNSSRKRSSVICEYEDAEPGQVPQKKLVLFCKGADSMITPRLRPGTQPCNRDSLETKNTMDTLNEFAVDGLRTLSLAGRVLAFDEFDAWMKKYEDAANSVENRQDKLDAVADDIEQDLELHGITGVEDRLQDQVGETIVNMTKAGIKVWMLTGDKIETAINIGIATGLLEPEAGDRPSLTTPDFEEDDTFQAKKLEKKLEEVSGQAAKLEGEGRLFEGMVIDGKCLEIALEPQNRHHFAKIGKMCRTVICCRVTPKQKGAVVALIKSAEQAVTLAIGDGANDCNMIQEAHVGIGIRGLEGLQAFNVCDYGISQFRFLQQLLFVHGRWCYRRVAICANYMFYKNIVVVLPQYFLGFVSGFSGQKLYNDLMYQAYNVVFTSLPIIIFGVLDQDVGRDVSLANPEVYSLGIQKAYMNLRTSVFWVATGVWHSVVVFYVPYFTMSNGNVTHLDGKANDIWMVGQVVFLLICLVTNFRILLEAFFFNWVLVFVLFLSALGWVCGSLMVSGIPFGLISPETHGTMTRLFSSPMLWIMIVVATMTALLPDIHLKGIFHTWRPTVLDALQDKVLEGKAKTATKPV